MREDGKEHVAVLRLTRRVLEAMLVLPEHWRVLGMHIEDYSRSIKLLVAADEFPEVNEGCDVQTLGDLQVTIYTMVDGDGVRWFRSEGAYNS